MERPSAHPAPDRYDLRRRRGSSASGERSLRLFAASTLAAVLLACLPGDAPESPPGAGAPATGAGEAAATDSSATGNPATVPASPGAAPSATVDDLQISNLVVAEPVTGERTALYLTIRNAGSEADALTGIQIDGAGRGSLHRTRMEGEVMSMRPVDAVEVPAGGTVRLRPGGLHGMLEGLEGRRLAVGDTLTLRLTFRRAGIAEVQALVVPYHQLGRLFPPEGESPQREGQGP